MTHSLHALFPTYIFETSLNIDTGKIISFINRINYDFNDNRSIRNGIQSGKIIHENEEIFNELNVSIHTFLNKSINDILIPIKENSADKLKYKTTEMWINITNPKGYNIEHNHPNSFMSGVFYLKVPSNSGNIVFRDPRPIPDWNGDSSLFYALNCNSFIIPKENMLLLFPSWLYHRVETNNSDERRISISFNIIKCF